jgi:hypothetical protein
MQELLGDSTIEDSPGNHIHSNLNTVYTIASDISSGVDQLAKVDLIVLDSDEANQVRPGRHREGYRTEKDGKVEEIETEGMKDK